MMRSLYRGQFMRAFALGAVAVLAAGACSSGAEEDASHGGGADGAITSTGDSPSSAGGSGTVGTTTAATTGTSSAGGATKTGGATTTAPAGPPAWSDCLPHGAVKTCAAYCAAVGSTCSNTCVSPYTGKPAGVLTFNNATCTSFAAGYTSACEGDVYPDAATRCCCGDPTFDSADSAPVILAFGTNVTSVSQGQQVIFTALVTDPDGADDVVGGTLLDEGGTTYGAFAMTPQEGSYQIALSWDQIGQVSPIDFVQGASAQRTFKAQFFDQAGHTVEQTVDLELTCNGQAACSGSCVDLMMDKLNCGACGHPCAGGACSQGNCQ